MGFETERCNLTQGVYKEVTKSDIGGARRSQNISLNQNIYLSTFL